MHTILILAAFIALLIRRYYYNRAAGDHSLLSLIANSSRSFHKKYTPTIVTK